MPNVAFTYLGTFLVGGTVALLLWAVARTLKRPLPRWVYPAAAGLTMLVYQVYNDYTWFGRNAGSLPPSYVVTSRHTQSSILQFWSLIVPPVDRFAVVDRTSIKRNPQVPDLVMANVILVTRFHPSVLIVQVFDCAQRRRADIHDRVTFDTGGRPQGLSWEELSADDPALEAACRPA